MTTHWNAVEQYFTVEPLTFEFYPVRNLENLSILDSTLVGVVMFMLYNGGAITGCGEFCMTR